MSIQNQEYVPYLRLSEEVIKADHNPGLFLRSLFPNATEEQVAIFNLYTVGKFHDGVIQGLEIAGRDAIGEIEAYKMGVTEGFNRSQEGS